ncbi:MAG: hypothetical protein J3Q66DRAFT_2575 [Benniella sp.]|nr:MAG: hypothetical protein J3Q66DRAFT_2575 [Benniella sp.]
MSTSTPKPFVNRRAPLLLLLLFCSLFLSLVDSALQPTSPASISPILKRQVGPDVRQDLPSYSCSTVGECHACSALQVQTTEVCKETHNRQRIECKYDDPKNDENEELKIRLPTYRSCLRVRAVEARRFAHFFSTNIFLALFSGILIVWRKRKLAAAQYRRMARRIGIA